MSSFCDMMDSHLKFLDVLKTYEVSDLTKETVFAKFEADMEKTHDEGQEELLC